ncbi:class I SAM-dependent methyltransferase [Aerococcaceae bacterium WGS1372]
MYNALQYSHKLLKKQVQLAPDGLFIDATLGNGHDSQFILSLKDFTGELIAFDIQSEAINRANQRIQSNIQTINKRYFFVLDSHENVSNYIENQTVQTAIFNLGYLPGGDHTITTQYSSTIKSINAILANLNTHGQVLIVIYSGHEEGMKEKNELINYYSKLPQEEFQVLSYQFINQVNYPPMLMVIEKIK